MQELAEKRRWYSSQVCKLVGGNALGLFWWIYKGLQDVVCVHVQVGLLHFVLVFETLCTFCGISALMPSCAIQIVWRYASFRCFGRAIIGTSAGSENFLIFYSLLLFCVFRLLSFFYVSAVWILLPLHIFLHTRPCFVCSLSQTLLSFSSFG